MNHETFEARGHVAWGSRLSGSLTTLAVVPAEPSVGRLPSTHARPHRTILRPIRPAGVTCAKLDHCAIDDMPKVLPPLPAHCIEMWLYLMYTLRVTIITGRCGTDGYSRRIPQIIIKTNVPANGDCGWWAVLGASGRIGDDDPRSDNVAHWAELNKLKREAFDLIDSANETFQHLLESLRRKGVDYLGRKAISELSHEEYMRTEIFSMDKWISAREFQACAVALNRPLVILSLLKYVSVCDKSR